MINNAGVIFIDCWDANSSLVWQDKGGIQNDFYLNMLDTLSKYEINKYVFHTSFLTLGYTTQDVVHYFKEFILSNNITDNQRTAFEDYLEFTGSEQLSRHLHTIAGNEKSIFIPTFAGFKKWCELTDINEWIVVGGHWPICTHEKPLGFNNLLEYIQETPRVKFYSIPSCTIKWAQNSISTDAEGVMSVNNDQQICTVCTNQDYAEDSKSWTKINDNLYRLNT